MKFRAKGRTPVWHKIAYNNPEAVEGFFDWINERHAIYLRRAAGEPAPWTKDPILRQYKFTNPFRENDRVTVWMRQNWTNPNRDRPWGEIIFNCCLFRSVGTSDFAEDHGWVRQWDPAYTKDLIETRLENKLKTFTGAYIVTNQGLKLRKSEVVADYFLSPLWVAKDHLAKVAEICTTLQGVHKVLGTFRGWGGGGFMAYEVVTDLNYTPVLQNAMDRFSWANAGPGAKRGLNRLQGRPLNKSISADVANQEMQELLYAAVHYSKNSCGRLRDCPIKQIDMRTIEHSLCEWDKYERVRLGHGRPRSRFDDSANRGSPVIGFVK